MQLPRATVTIDAPQHRSPGQPAHRRRRLVTNRQRQLRQRQRRASGPLHRLVQQLAQNSNLGIGVTPQRVKLLAHGRVTAGVLKHPAELKGGGVADLGMGARDQVQAQPVIASGDRIGRDAAHRR